MKRLAIALLCLVAVHATAQSIGTLDLTLPQEVVLDGNQYVIRNVSWVAPAPTIPHSEFLLSEWLFPASGVTNNSSTNDTWDLVDPGGAASPLPTNFGGVECIYVSTDDHYNAGDSSNRYFISSNGQNVVMAGWFYETSYVQYQTPWASLKLNLGDEWRFYELSSNNFTFVTRTGTEPTGGQIPMNEWVFFCYVSYRGPQTNPVNVDHGRTHWGTNGQPILNYNVRNLDADGWTHSYGKSGTDMWIGNMVYGGSYGWNGYINDLRIWRFPMFDGTNTFSWQDVTNLFLLGHD